MIISNPGADKKDKESGNIFEFSITGIYEPSTRADLKVQIEEMCENNYLPYNYEIITYFLQAQHQFQKVTNLIEFHHNITENYKTNEYKIDNTEFYNGVNFMEKIEEYLIISKYYLKYFTNAFIDFRLGTSTIVEMARCEENMDMILTSLGYKEKSTIRKRGDLIKFKNSPIIILITQMEKLSFEVAPSGTVVSNDTNVNMNVTKPAANMPQKKRDLVIPNLIEIIGYCYEHEKENFMAALNSIQDKISTYCIFESDAKKI